MSREEARECVPLFYVPSYQSLGNDKVEALRNDPRDWNAQDRLATALIVVGRVPDAVPILIKIADKFAEDGFRVVVRDRWRRVQRLSPDHPGVAPGSRRSRARGVDDRAETYGGSPEPAPACASPTRYHATRSQIIAALSSQP